MLFLINDQVFDVADPVKSAQEHIELLTSLPLNRVSAVAAIEIGREVYFQAAGERPMRKVLFALAALLADRTDANAVLFLTPPNAKSREDVMFRIVDAPITSLAYLRQMQVGDIVPAHLVNQAIWHQAA